MQKSWLKKHNERHVLYDMSVYLLAAIILGKGRRDRKEPKCSNMCERLSLLFFFFPVQNKYPSGRHIIGNPFCNSVPCCINHHSCIGKSQCWRGPKRSQTQKEGKGKKKKSARILPETINRRNLIISTDKVVILPFPCCIVVVVVVEERL